MRTFGKLPLPPFCLKDTSLLEALANIKERNYSASLHKIPPSLILLEKNTCFNIWVSSVCCLLPHASAPLERRSPVSQLAQLPAFFWPHRGGRTRTKWVNLELGGLCWKGTTGKKVHLSFITFCLKHMGRIRSYIFILMSWDFEACLEIYARPSIWSETILLWCACTSSIFLWFSPPVIYQWWLLTHRMLLTLWIWLWTESLAKGKAKFRFLSYRKTVVHKEYWGQDEKMWQV